MLHPWKGKTDMSCLLLDSAIGNDIIERKKLKDGYEKVFSCFQNNE
jgi:hypothetical protein